MTVPTNGVCQSASWSFFFKRERGLVIPPTDTHQFLFTKLLVVNFCRYIWVLNHKEQVWDGWSWANDQDQRVTSFPLPHVHFLLSSPSWCSSSKYWLCTHYFFSFSFFNLHPYSPLPCHFSVTGLLFLSHSDVVPTSFCPVPSQLSFSSHLSFPLLCHPLPLPSCFSCNRPPVSSSLQMGKAVSPSQLQWPIESCWAPISLLIGWAGLSRYWEEGLALLASWLSACLPVCLPAWPPRLCSRADLRSVKSCQSQLSWWQSPFSYSNKLGLRLSNIGFILTSSQFSWRNHVKLLLGKPQHFLVSLLKSL